MSIRFFLHEAGFRKAITPYIAVFAAILVFWQQNTAVADDHTLRIEEYGIKFSLEDKDEKSRWEITDLSQENRPNGKKKAVIIASANDKFEVANFRLFARKKNSNKSLGEWVKKHIKKRLKKYSRYWSGYSINNQSEVELPISSGGTARVKYISLNLLGEGITKDTAFVYFPHKGRYYYFFVFNSDASFELKDFVEKILLPGLELF